METVKHARAINSTEERVEGSWVVQIVLAQPDKGPDRSEMSLVVLLLCNIYSFIILWLIQQNFRRERPGCIESP